MEVKIYTVGKGNVPDWVKSEGRAGRIRFNYDEDNELKNVKVITPVKDIIANIDDVILLTRAGLGVIPKDKASKYLASRGLKNAKSKETSENTDAE